MASLRLKALLLRWCVVGMQDPYIPRHCSTGNGLNDLAHVPTTFMCRRNSSCGNFVGQWTDNTRPVTPEYPILPDCASCWLRLRRIVQTASSRVPIRGHNCDSELLMNRDRHRKRAIKGAISSGIKARSLSLSLCVYRVQRRRKMNTVLMRINGHTHIVDVPAGRGCICSSVRVRPAGQSVMRM